MALSLLLTLSTLKKTARQIVDSGNHYLGALKGNQGDLFRDVKTHFHSEDTDTQVCKGHGRIEHRRVCVCRDLEGIGPWPGLSSLIRVESRRDEWKGDVLFVGKPQVHYYISSLAESAKQFAERIRSYWGVENKVHYVRDVTQGEDACRIRTVPLPQIWTIARNLALNLYRGHGFKNMAQAQRLCSLDFNILMQAFRMK